MFKEKELIKKIGCVVLIFLVIVFIILFKPDSSCGGYIENNDGDLVGIYLRDGGLSEEFKLKAVNELGEETEVSINLDMRTENNEEDLTQSTFKQEVNSLIYEIRETKEDRIDLPDELNDGTKIIWKRVKNRNSYIAILVIPILLILGLIKENEKKEDKINKNKREEIIRELPGFTNQIILLMNSSLILNDCLIKISDNYEDAGVKNRSELKNDLIELVKQSEALNIGSVYAFYQYASAKRIKELSRLSAVMLENVEKGTDIRDKLDRESEYLWESRKAISREKGRFIETKMTIPLGLLLVTMIVITMAPAIMNM